MVICDEFGILNSYMFVDDLDIYMVLTVYDELVTHYMIICEGRIRVVVWVWMSMMRENLRIEYVRMKI